MSIVRYLFSMQDADTPISQLHLPACASLHIMRFSYRFTVQDADTSIRRRAMDLLFTMCDSSCAEDLVKEMLAYLQVCGWVGV
jgi:AP-2 complex subunit alpha